MLPNFPHEEVRSRAIGTRYNHRNEQGSRRDKFRQAGSNALRSLVSCAASHDYTPLAARWSLPGGRSTEVIAILPFIPANRNNLIGWIAGRSDGEHYGEAVVYDFPKHRLRTMSMHLSPTPLVTSPIISN
jgi:Uncharacterised protein family (UPF0182)